MFARSLNLNQPVSELKSIGPKNAARLKKLGITTVRHLLWHLPARYDDYSQTISIASLEVGSKVTVQGEVIKILTKRIFPRRLTIVDAIIQDSSGAVKAVWFNQPYIATAIPEGSVVSLAGKVNLDKRGVYLASPTYEKITGSDRQLRHTAGLIPVYPETAGITSKYLRFLIKPLLDDWVFEDPIPEKIRRRHGLMSLAAALKSIHYPTDADDIELAKQRLAFEDLILFQLKALLERRKVSQLSSGAMPFDAAYTKEIIASLPFTLTGDQKIAAWEILSDLARPYPMNRLLEGDVGSGKTVVAFLAAMQAARHNFQTVFMAPTEVLALQHFKTMNDLARPFGVAVALLTNSQALLNNRNETKASLKREISRGNPKIVIGTHAVIQKDVRFSSLGLVVVDEQHRFGIAQRSALIKSDRQSHIPHLLSMTATPIPRTLALTIFGDLDISLIREKPKYRQTIITQVVSDRDRKKTYQFIDDQINQGRQVFVICPRIQLGDPVTELIAKGQQSKLNLIWAEVKAVTQEYERLSKDIFPKRRIAMLHGKMKPNEKQSAMTEFKAGRCDILVSTSVIEVGVDVPNATIMLIEGADRFGLAQLHQFRGRVGRDQYQSHCFLFASGGQATARLTALVRYDDGFTLAEKDMAIRGPGEFFGLKQSGLPDLTMASLANLELIKKARLEARLILKDDPQLIKYPLLQERLAEFRRMTHFE